MEQMNFEGARNPVILVSLAILFGTTILFLYLSSDESGHAGHAVGFSSRNGAELILDPNIARLSSPKLDTATRNSGPAGHGGSSAEDVLQTTQKRILRFIGASSEDAVRSQTPIVFRGIRTLRDGRRRPVALGPFVFPGSHDVEIDCESVELWAPGAWLQSRRAEFSSNDIAVLDFVCPHAFFDSEIQVRLRDGTVVSDAVILTADYGYIAPQEIVGQTSREGTTVVNAKSHRRVMAWSPLHGHSRPFSLSASPTQSTVAFIERCHFSTLELVTPPARDAERSIRRVEFFPVSVALAGRLNELAIQYDIEAFTREEPARVPYGDYEVRLFDLNGLCVHCSIERITTPSYQITCSSVRPALVRVRLNSVPISGISLILWDRKLRRLCQHHRLVASGNSDWSTRLFPGEYSLRAYSTHGEVQHSFVIAPGESDFSLELNLIDYPLLLRGVCIPKGVIPSGLRLNARLVSEGMIAAYAQEVEVSNDMSFEFFDKGNGALERADTVCLVNRETNELVGSKALSVDGSLVEVAFEVESFQLRRLQIMHPSGSPYEGLISLVCMDPFGGNDRMLSERAVGGLIEFESLAGGEIQLFAINRSLGLRSEMTTIPGSSSASWSATQVQLTGYGTIEIFGPSDDSEFAGSVRFLGSDNSARSFQARHGRASLSMLRLGTWRLQWHNGDGERAREVEVRRGVTTYVRFGDA